MVSDRCAAVHSAITASRTSPSVSVQARHYVERDGRPAGRGLDPPIQAVEDLGRDVGDPAANRVIKTVARNAHGFHHPTPPRTTQPRLTSKSPHGDEPIAT